jgi:hypothetical protein
LKDIPLDGNTTIWGPVADQTALHGLLMRIRDLGLPLIALQRVETESTIVTRFLFGMKPR